MICLIIIIQVFQLYTKIWLVLYNNIRFDWIRSTRILLLLHVFSYNSDRLGRYMKGFMIPIFSITYR